MTTLIVPVVQLTDSSDYVNKCIADIVQAGKSPINPATLLTYGLDIMNIIENLPSLTAAQRLHVLTCSVQQVISLSGLPSQEIIILQGLAIQIIPSFAAILCHVANGMSGINKKIEDVCCVIS